MTTKQQRVTGRDLYRLVSSLNVKHNVDQPDLGFLSVEPHYAGHRNLFRCYVRASIGRIYVTDWGTPRVVIEQLRTKDWRRVLIVAGTNPFLQLPSERPNEHI